MDLAIKIVELLIQAIIGGGLIWVAIEANKIGTLNSRRLSAEERKKTEEILEKAESAFFSVIRSGNASEDDMYKMSSAATLSKIYISDRAYKELFDLYKKFVDLHYVHKELYDVNGQPINMGSEKRSKDTDKEAKIFKEIHSFDIHELFANYLKISTYSKNK